MDLSRRIGFTHPNLPDVTLVGVSGHPGELGDASLITPHGVIPILETLGIDCLTLVGWVGFNPTDDEKAATSICEKCGHRIECRTDENYVDRDNTILRCDECLQEQGKVRNEH